MAAQTDLFTHAAFLACLLVSPVNGIVYLFACPPVGSVKEFINDHIFHIGSRFQNVHIRLDIPPPEGIPGKTKTYQFSMQPYEVTDIKVEKKKIVEGRYMPIRMETDNLVDVTALSQTQTSTSNVYNVYPLSSDAVDFILTVPPGSDTLFILALKNTSVEYLVYFKANNPLTADDQFLSGETSLKALQGLYLTAGTSMEYTGGTLQANHGIAVVCGQESSLATIAPRNQWYTESVGLMCPFLSEVVDPQTNWLMVFVSQNLTNVTYVDGQGISKTTSVAKVDRHLMTYCTEPVVFFLKASSPICAIVSFHANNWPSMSSFSPLVPADGWLSRYTVKSFKKSFCGLLIFMPVGMSSTVFLNDVPLSENKYMIPVTGSDLYVIRTTTDSCDKLLSLTSNKGTNYGVYMIGEGKDGSYYVPAGSAMTSTFDRDYAIPVFEPTDSDQIVTTPEKGLSTAAALPVKKKTTDAPCHGDHCKKNASECTPFTDANCNVSSAGNTSDFKWRVCDDANVACSGPVFTKFTPILSSMLLKGWQTALIILIGIPTVLGLGVTILFYYRYMRSKRRQRALSQVIDLENFDDGQHSQSDIGAWLMDKKTFDESESRSSSESKSGEVLQEAMAVV